MSSPLTPDASGASGVPACRRGSLPPWRILFVITSSDIGGAEHIVRELATRLDRHEFAPAVCSLRPCGRTASEIAAAGTPVRSLGMSARPTATELIRGSRQLARWLDDLRVDLVHSFLYRGNLVARVAARRAACRPVVVSGQHSLGALGGFHVELAARWTRNLSRRVIAASNAVGEAVLRIEGGAPERVTVIENGIDTERYTVVEDGALRRAHGIDTGAIVAGSVGRLAREKGHHLLLEAAALASAHGCPLKLLLAGSGPEAPNLERQARQLGIAEHIRFLGTRHDPRPVYAALDIFALASREEACPTALLEAMACGCPVVATNVGGVPEIIEDQHSGLLVAPGSAADLAAVLVRLASDRTLRQRLGAAARQRVVERFGVERMVRRHGRLYRELLEGK